MKNILIQNKTISLLALDSLSDLLKYDFRDLGIESTRCLSTTKLSIDQYSLIFCHPHLSGNCCIPLVSQANENKTPIIFTYRVRTEETEILEAMSDTFKIEIERQPLGGAHSFYYELIRSLENKF